jgi:hypothetical protein
MEEAPKFRTRYSSHAIALIVVCAVLYVAELTMMAVLLMPMLPLIPLFFTAIVGHGCLLASVIDYAKSHARIEPVGRAHSEPRHGATPPPHRDAPQPA